MEEAIGSVKQADRKAYLPACIEWECHNSLPSLDDHELQPNLVWREHMILKGAGTISTDPRATSFDRRNFPCSAKERAGHAQNGSETRIISPLSALGGSEGARAGQFFGMCLIPIPSHFPFTSFNGINCLSRECPPPVSTPWLCPCGERRERAWVRHG